MNKTIRQLTQDGALSGRHAASIELAKLVARRLDAAEDAGNAGEAVRLTKELRGLLADLQPKEARGDDRPAPPAPGGPTGHTPGPGLAGIIGAPPEVGNSPVAG